MIGGRVDRDNPIKYPMMFNGYACTEQEYEACKLCWGDSFNPLSADIEQYLIQLRTAAIEPEYTGGSSSYYLVHVANPTTKGMPPYTAECNDIIEALNMNYAEGNAFKAIWRRNAAELGKSKKGYDNGLYDAEKIVFFGERMVVQSKAKGSK